MEVAGKVLLADDSRFFRAIEKQFLRKAPVTVLEASTVEDAWKLLVEHHPRLVYLAFSLDDSGGDDFCRQIKSSAELRKTAVIMVCEGNRPEQIGRVRQAGCDGILTKPLDRHKFLELGSQFVESIRSHRQSCLLSLTVTTHGEPFAGKCLDISPGGMFLQTAEPLTEGDSVKFEFKLSAESTEIVRCSGVVAWINHRENPFKPHYPFGYGIRFTGISSHGRDLISGYIDGRNSDR